MEPVGRALLCGLSLHILVYTCHVGSSATSPGQCARGSLLFCSGMLVDVSRGIGGRVFYNACRKLVDTLGWLQSKAFQGHQA
jgi:hypothetical protein